MIKINRNPNPKELHVFGLLLVGFSLGVGLLLHFRFQAGQTAIAAVAAGWSLACLYFLFPPLRKPIYLGWMYATFPIGWTVSNIVLAVVFYAVLSPIGLVMRLLGRDSMNRRFDRQASTYWSQRHPPESIKRYFQQF